MQDSSALRVESGSADITKIWERQYPDGISWDMPIQTAPVQKILEDAVIRFGDKPAIDFQGLEMSYEQLGALVNKIAAGLQQNGVGKDVKVGLFLPNCHHTITFHYGILKAGGTVVNYNPLYAEQELIAQANDSETRYLVTLNVPGLVEKAQKVLSETGIEKLVLCPADDFFKDSKEFLEISDTDTSIAYDTLIDNKGDVQAVSVDPDEDVAVLQYTGGTTGTPKGAMLTHSNVYANVLQTSYTYDGLAAPGEDVQIGVLPLFHVFAMTVVMHLSVWYGMKIVVVQKFDPKTMIPLLEEKKPTFFPAVPAVFTSLASHPKAEGLDLSCVKFCKSGGAPLPGEVKNNFHARTGATIGEAYGLTETSPVATSNPLQGQIKIGSVGVPIPGTRVDIVSLDDGKTVLGTGEKGEICISGPQVMKGYYKKPEATAEAIRDGRLHTGDIGYMDEEGYVYLVDRLKDMAIINGYNVYPRHVEEAIYKHPSVEECIVAAVPDEKRGEVVWAWIKTVDGAVLDRAEISEFLSDKISPIERPRKFIIGEEPLPKTAVGKLSKKLLLEREGLSRA